MSLNRRHFASLDCRVPFNSALALLTLFSIIFLTAGQAVAVQSNGGYVTTTPTLANWNSGWSSGTNTGWNYVGQVNGASGVYLGNNWVITAAHIGAGNFSLGGTTYSVVAGSAHGITSGTDSVDLTLFKLSSAPSLTALTLPGSSQDLSGMTTAMIGFGGGHGETWGADTISNNLYYVTPSGYTYVSIDFQTLYGSGNTAVLVGGDSGGGDFVYSNGHWLLAGINEAVDGSFNSYMVDLSQYKSQINAIVGVPEPDALLLAGIGAFICLSRHRRN